MRLTSRGIGIIALAGLCLLAGIGLHMAELVAIAAGLVFLVLVSLAAVAAAPRVDVTPPQALRVARGTEATLDVVIVDHGSRSLSGMQFRNKGGAGPALVGLPRLTPDVPVAARLPIPTQRRGPVTMGPWTVERTDAWMLVRRTVTRVPAVEVVVVPRVHMLRVPTPTPTAEERRQAREMGESDVATLREYVIGDEIRHIHWRSTAKIGELMVRQEVDSRRPGVHVVLDVSPTSYSGDLEFEEAVDAAASLAISAALSGVPVHLTTTAGESARAGGGRHAGVLDLLARVTPESSRSSRDRAKQGRGTVFAVTGSAGPMQGRGSRLTVRVGGVAQFGAASGVLEVAHAADLPTALPSLSSRPGSAEVAS